MTKSNEEIEAHKLQQYLEKEKHKLKTLREKAIDAECIEEALNIDGQLDFIAKIAEHFDLCLEFKPQKGDQDEN
jgi:hypothetical protein